jgi:hypothetical protein
LKVRYWKMNNKAHKLLFYAYGRGIISASQLRELLSMNIEINGIEGVL